ncbi:MAG: hypothetical protein KBT03_09540 [Bacteroidales bacterium]|nr:hypothetical protein [Candidatus Scybalousia scybalohippi]
MKKLWEYMKAHKKQTATAGVFIVCAIWYVIVGQNIDPQPLIDKVCTIIGC